jgi:diguanylate cyclase (GGDEF)-like protein
MPWGNAMSLTKQLWLAILAVLSIAFGVSFLVSALSARHYLEDQLRLKNIDNANSLALSMSQMQKDPVTIELLISAQFDSGHYQYITLTSPSGKVLASRTSDAGADQVPAWFANLIPIHAEPGIAKVQDGWRQFGTLTVKSHSRYAQLALWQGSLNLLFWFLAGALITGFAGTFILHRITRPLRDVVEQAEAIGARRFITLREPRTQEFRSLVRAMNTHATQVRTMLEEESARLEQLRRDAQHDSLTGLLNREHFLKQTKQALEGENVAPTGALFVVRLPELVQMNKDIGRDSTDALLRRIAEALDEFCGEWESCQIGRLNGGDFAVLAPNAGSVEMLAHQIFAHIQLLINDPSSPTEQKILVGAAAYHHGDNISQLLSLADNALARAEQKGGSAVEAESANVDTQPASSLAAWKDLIETALDKKRIKFATFPVLNGQGRLIHFEAPARMQIIQDALWMSGKEFIPWASRLGMIKQIDQAIFEHAMSWLEKETQPLCINLSPESMCDAGLTERMHQVLVRIPTLAGRLWIDIPEFGAYLHARAFRAFCNSLKPLGCKIGLEHVGNQIHHIGELHDLGLDYLKIDSAIIHDIDKSMGNQTFLRGVCTIAHAMGMMTIAEGVLNQQEAHCLVGLGFDGMTGPGIVIP